MKLKMKITKVEYDNANKILENYLGETDDICKVMMQYMQWAEHLRKGLV